MGLNYNPRILFGRYFKLHFLSLNHDMDQLSQKLLFTTLELEKLKAEAMDEMRKNKEYIKQLIHLLKYAIQERDEARNQLNKLLKNPISLTTKAESYPTIPLFQPESPLVKTAKANSSITESNSLSETYNYRSHGSSPVESLLDAVSSPDFSNINLVVNQPLVQDSPKVDQGSLIIDNLVKGRVLPQKGKFLQAVLQAGPLLQTLLVAGPLPRWRNPPQFQPFQIPPVSIKGCENGVFSQKQVSNVGQLASRSLNSQPYACLSFANLGSGTCLTNASLISSEMNTSGYAPLAKRQRFS
ncbi:hypothetical protein CDL12_03311 [Handroanthus impetiginosus]|uniref:Uncharacterized protein n=1 Tax=Handroanthus impetiginosus TaxID=429701 RepID=A0A2G9I2I8_9LAMI|nr:hypothetical protein CDL12_03311 [Handroanthus impetiginosus]